MMLSMTRVSSAPSGAVDGRFACPTGREETQCNGLGRRKGTTVTDDQQPSGRRHVTRGIIEDNMIHRSERTVDPRTRVREYLLKRMTRRRRRCNGGVDGGISEQQSA